jgi:transposase InsO family protein
MRNSMMQQRRFTKEFEEEAVRLVQTSGRTQREIAGDLGIGLSTLVRSRELRDSGLTVGRRRTARLMRENGLRARQKRRFKRTTDSQHAWPVAPNLLDQDFTATGPDEKWGADISYVWTREGWLYLAVVIDLFARRALEFTSPAQFEKMAAE